MTPDDSPKGLMLLMHGKPSSDSEADDKTGLPDGLEDSMKDFCEAMDAKDYAGMAHAWMDAKSLGEGEADDAEPS
jgi:hypothetical protein